MKTNLFAECTIKSISSELPTFLHWADFLQYLESNSNTVKLGSYVPSRDHSLNVPQTLPKAGVGLLETVVIQILATATYEAGKYVLTEILNKIKEPHALKNYVNAQKGLIILPAGYSPHGITSLTVEFADKKSISIHLPLPARNSAKLTNLDWSRIDEELKSKNHLDLHLTARGEFEIGLFIDFRA